MFGRILDSVKTQFRTNNFLRVGLPFISFVVLGSFGLAEFTDIKVWLYLSLVCLLGCIK